MQKTRILLLLGFKPGFLGCSTAFGQMSAVAGDRWPDSWNTSDSERRRINIEAEMDRGYDSTWIIESQSPVGER